MRILDTHLHLVYQDRFSYPWLGGAGKLNRQWTVEDYYAEAKGLGIDRALHMEVDVAESDMLAETEFMLRVHPLVVGAIANGRPESENFAAYLDALPAGVRGIRRLLQFQPPELSQSATFIENLKRLPARQLVFDLCLKSHELDVARVLIPKCPDVQFVLDHCGNPKIAGGEWDGWVSQIKAIAAFPNVACKVSGILANVDDAWTVDQLRPYVETVIETFGWDRVVWGSDHPVVTLFADLGRWVEASRTIVGGAIQDEQEKLFFRNAERIYRVA
jgi:predicted TIM-barrel fold metal-dependent hydrolase